jgi:hypothetical protein
VAALVAKAHMEGTKRGIEMMTKQTEKTKITRKEPKGKWLDEEEQIR